MTGISFKFCFIGSSIAGLALSFIGVFLRRLIIPINFVFISTNLTSMYWQTILLTFFVYQLIIMFSFRVEELTLILLCLLNIDQVFITF